MGCVAAPAYENEDKDAGFGGFGGSVPGPPVIVDANACPGGCPSGKDCCAGSCVDLDRDVEHCGACDNACPADGGSGVCEQGLCSIVCREGRADCDGISTNGCEAKDPGPPTVVELLRPMLGVATGSHITAGVTGALRPTFTWKALDEGICDDDLSYEIQVDDSCPIEGFSDCTFESPEVGEVVLDATFTPDDDLPVSTVVPVGTRYFWRVRACDGLERCSDWSAVRYLDVGRERQDVTGDGYADIVVQSGIGDDEPYAFFAGGSELGRGVAGEPVDLVPDRIFAEGGAARSFLEVNPPVVRFVGDVNGDGFHDFVADGPQLNAYQMPDIACATRLLYLGAADVAGITPILFSTSSYAPDWGLSHNFGAGDFDGDGYADIWAAQSIWRFAGGGTALPTEPRVFLFSGRADVADLPFPDDPDGVGADFTGVYTPTASVEPRPDDGGELLGVSVEPGDFNGDGLVDVVMIAPDDRLVYLIVGGGEDYVVDRAIEYGGAAAKDGDCENPRLSVADFNRDGFDDFAINCPEQELIEVYFGGDPLPKVIAFEQVVNPNMPSTLLDTLAADLDGDGRVDLAAGSPSGYLGTSSASLWILLGKGFSVPRTESSTLPIWATPGYFGAADHNGDGHVDLVVASQPTAWLPGDGSLDFVGAGKPALAPRLLLRDDHPINSATVGR